MDSEILREKRTIKGIYFDDSEDSCYMRTAGNTITAYGEPGPHCWIPYFKVENNGLVIARVPAWKVTVTYE